MSKKSNKLLKTPSVSDAHTENLAKKEQKFGNSGSLSQEMATGFIENRLLSTPTETDYKSSGPKSKQVGKDNFMKLLRTPSSQEAGVKSKRLQTKNGEPAKIEERAYDKETGRLAQVGLEQQINFYSQEASPVNPLVTQDESVARQTVVTSGRRLSQSLKLSNPIGSFLRTCLESSIWYSPIVRLEWQAKPLYSVLRMTKSAIIQQSADESNQASDKQGMKQYGLLFQLAVSPLPTEGIGYGLLPTTSATPRGAHTGEQSGSVSEDGQSRMSAKGTKWGATLQTKIHQAGLLPTITGQETEHPQAKLTEKGRRETKDKTNSHSLNISDTIAMLPTPKAIDAIVRHSEKMARKKTENNGDVDLSIAVMMSQDGQKTGMKLQPEFALWMMGFPMDWLDLKDGE